MEAKKKIPVNNVQLQNQKNEGKEKDMNNTVEQKNSSQSRKLDIIERFKESQQRVTIKPYQDYVDGVLYYGMCIDKERYVISSKKEIIPFDDVEDYGIRLYHKDLVESGISAEVLERFIEQECKEINVLQCFEDIRNYYKKHSYLENEKHFDVLAIWTMATYIYRCFDNYMYIWLNGSMGSGKTTLLYAMSEIAFNGLIASNITEAALTRSVHSNGNTVFYDEAESFSKQEESTTKQAINSGSKKNGRIRKCDVRGKRIFLESFDVGSFKAFAGINNPPPTIADRSLKIATKVNELFADLEPDWDEIRNDIKRIKDNCYFFGLIYAKEIYDLYNKRGQAFIPENIKNRERDKWKPLLTIAHFIDSKSNSSILDCIKEVAESQTIEKFNEKIEKDFAYKTAKWLQEYVELHREEDRRLRLYGNDYVYKTEWVYEYFRSEGYLEEIVPSYYSRRVTLTKFSQLLNKYLEIKPTVIRCGKHSEKAYKLNEKFLMEKIKEYENKLKKVEKTSA